jgi:hypothetical protein
VLERMTMNSTDGRSTYLLEDLLKRLARTFDVQSGTVGGRDAAMVLVSKDHGTA